MSREPEYTGRARRDLKHLDPQTAARVIAAVERLAETGEGDVRKLVNVHPPTYRLRVGDWRVLFRYATVPRSISVRRVLPRGDAYR